MLLVRILLGLLLGYAVLVLLAWAFQERIAFPAPRAPVPDPRQVGAANGERIELVLRDGTKLAGWYLAPRSPTIGRPPCSGSTGTERTSLRSGASCATFSLRARRCSWSTIRATGAAAGGRPRRACTRRPTQPTRPSRVGRRWTAPGSTYT